MRVCLFPGEYINNIISFTESTCGLVVITVRAKMRFAPAAKSLQHSKVDRFFSELTHLGLRISKSLQIRSRSLYRTDGGFVKTLDTTNDNHWQVVQQNCDRIRKRYRRWLTGDRDSCSKRRQKLSGEAVMQIILVSRERKSSQPLNGSCLTRAVRRWLRYNGVARSILIGQIIVEIYVYCETKRAPRERRRLHRAAPVGPFV